MEKEKSSNAGEKRFVSLEGIKWIKNLPSRQPDPAFLSAPKSGPLWPQIS